MKNSVLAWHWVKSDRTLCDGNTVEAGYVYSVPRESLVMCEWGLHASISPLDALKYAPGSVIYRVECRGRILHERDKLVCNEREVLWMADAEPTLHEFARWCASSVAHLWDAPEIVRRYLETGDESIRDAAWTAALNAYWDKAIDAARAAWDAAGISGDAQSAELERRLIMLEPK